jgi:hypothetical protein
MQITFYPVTVETGSYDQQGTLAYCAAKLVAVLVRLDELHGEASDNWFIEALFAEPTDHNRTFPSLEAAKVWLERHVGDVMRRRARYTVADLS